MGENFEDIFELGFLNLALFLLVLDVGWTNFPFLGWIFIFRDDIATDLVDNPDLGLSGNFGGIVATSLGSA